MKAVAARILLVDDSRSFRSYLRSVLEKAGHQVIAEAGNGEEAVCCYKSHHPDLVLMDLDMPVKNGIMGTQEILAYDPQAVVVVCSSFFDEEVVNQALGAGARGYIHKSTGITELLSALGSHLSNGHKA